ncbi:hypothetical protein H5410_035984, partial [Solanum commersonii]
INSWKASLRCKGTNLVHLKPVVIGSSWVQLERVNPRPSPTHSAGESEWAKGEACYSRNSCSRETELIQDT